MGDNFRRIALFGGTFDPIHNGHLILAEWCLAELGLDQLIFVPNRIHPFVEKAHSISVDHRLNMIKKALTSYKSLIMDDIEIRQNKTSYTIDTIRHYLQHQSKTELYYLIGADNLADFDKWKDHDLLLKMARFVVFKRKSGVHDKTGKYSGFQYLNNPVIEISSTLIRRRIANNLPYRSMIPTGVYEYIRDNNLYSA